MKNFQILISFLFICFFSFGYNVKADPLEVTDFTGKICYYGSYESTDDVEILYAVISQSYSAISYSNLLSSGNDQFVYEISNWSSFLSGKNYSLECPKYIYKDKTVYYATDNEALLSEIIDKLKLIENGNHAGAFCHYTRRSNVPLNLLIDIEKETIVNTEKLGTTSEKFAKFAK